MLPKELINPKSIVVVGGSNNLKKPGGKLVQNLLVGGYQGQIRIVNKSENTVQGISCFSSVSEISYTELAILAIPATDCLDAVKILTQKKGTKAFIIISAGFSEGSKAGLVLENEIVKQINKVKGCLIGPNCIGILNQNYNGVFTTPIPKLDSMGCDLISGSGATAVFLIEAGIPLGLKFSSVFSVGNSAQTGIEDILAHLDEAYIPGKSSPIKLLYLETLVNPQKFFKHAKSLSKKGCRIAAIKAGSSLAGSRAASSHTGALASPDMAVRALFQKAGVVYCSSREELLAAASVFTYKPLQGKNIAVITHAGGSAVMLTDELTKGGLSVPELSEDSTRELLTYLNSGSYVSNPIDFLATGTAEQLGIIIDYCEHKFHEIDAMIVVFGSPGLFDVENVYKVLNVKLEVCKKPIFPVLPSIINAHKEIQYFLSKGKVNFPDEVILGKALCSVFNTPLPQSYRTSKKNDSLQSLVDTSENGYLFPGSVQRLLAEVGIKTIKECILYRLPDNDDFLNELGGYPIVMKVIGILHKTEVDGVITGINNWSDFKTAFTRLMDIKGAQGVTIQPFVKGFELFIGAKYEPKFGHLILVGMGGILVEIIQDVQAVLSPISKQEALQTIKKLKCYNIFQGVRGKKPVSEVVFADLLTKVSVLVNAIPEIEELDLNPLIACGDKITVVDARIKINKLL